MSRNARSPPWIRPLSWLCMFWKICCMKVGRSAGKSERMMLCGAAAGSAPAARGGGARAFGDVRELVKAAPAPANKAASAAREAQLQAEVENRRLARQLT